VKAPPFGINVIGYVTAPLGLGIAARNSIRRFLDLGAEVSVLDVPSEAHVSHPEHEFEGLLADPDDPLPYGVNLFHLNPPEIQRWVHDLDLGAHLRSRLNVCVPFWELPRVPLLWLPALRAMDLVLAPTRYLYETLAADVPSRSLAYYPQVLDLPEPPAADRVRWGLPEGRIVFGMSFDVKSDLERKNPWGVIEAFERAFPPGEEQAALAIKVNRPTLLDREVEALASLRGRAGTNPAIVLLERDLTYADVLSFYASCDVIVSLHRAEGLGMVVIEGMHLGKPVITTAWSGTMDFTTPADSCLVGYELIPAQGSQTQYSSRFVGRAVHWADPDLDQAADWMRRLAADPVLRRTMGERARARVARVQWRHNDPLVMRQLAARHAGLSASNGGARSPLQAHASGVLECGYVGYVSSKQGYRAARRLVGAIRGA